MSSCKDITIIGAGIIGVCCAINLQQEGYKVTLIDRLEPGTATSYGNAGLITPNLIYPLSTLDILLKTPNLLLDKYSALSIPIKYMYQLFPWLLKFVWAANPNQANRSTNALIKINKQAISAYNQLLSLTNSDSFVKKKGVLFVYESDKKYKQDVKKNILHIEHGFNLEYLNKQETHDLEPNLHNNVLKSILYKDNIHTINPLKLTHNLMKFYINNGGEIIQDEIKNLKYTNNKITINSDKKNYTANNLLLCLGAWTKKLTNILGYNIPLETERGYHIMLPEHKNLFNHPIIAADRDIAITPMDTALRVAGLVELGGLDLPPNSKNHNVLRYHIDAITRKNINFNNISKWMGYRPSLPDSLPVISRSEKHKNIYFAFGHHHLGLTQAAITGKWISRLITNKMDINEMAEFSIDRF